MSNCTARFRETVTALMRSSFYCPALRCVFEFRQAHSRRRRDSDEGQDESLCLPTVDGRTFRRYAPIHHSTLSIALRIKVERLVLLVMWPGRPAVTVALRQGC